MMGQKNLSRAGASSAQGHAGVSINPIIAGQRCAQLVVTLGDKIAAHLAGVELGGWA